MTEHTLDGDSRRLLVYAVDKNILPGPYPPRPDDATIGWYREQFPDPVLTKGEQEGILWHGRLALHHTYSMQQSDFKRAGCILTAEGSVWLPFGYVVGLGTRDRYDIFSPAEGLEVITYETVEEWRANRDAEKEGWTP